MKFSNFVIALIATVTKVTNGATIDPKDCQTHEIDFILVEGDAVRSSVEDNIVQMLSKVGIKVNTRKLERCKWREWKKEEDQNTYNAHTH